ncbi:hypothetical protein LTR94_028890, partial [Friedmanniomyces endolithicus]
MGGKAKKKAQRLATAEHRAERPLLALASTPLIRMLSPAAKAADEPQLLALGIGMVVGILNVFFRDVGQVMTIALQFWFWFTPIVYPASILPEHVRPLLDWNPMAPVIQAWQTVLVKGQSPDWSSLGFPLVLALLLCALGLRMFRKRAGEIVDELGLGKAYKQYKNRWARLADWTLPGQRHALKWVLEDISFTIAPGEAVGLIGVNGAGKSTLLKLITGTTQPTVGA